MYTISRRQCLASLCGFGLGAAAGYGSAAAMSRKPSRNPVALQLYTVRDAAREDFTGTLERVAEIGYGAVEFAGYGGLSASDLRARLDELGLVCAGSHIGFSAFYDDADAVLSFCSEAGIPYAVVPSMPGEIREGGADAYRRFGETLTRYGRRFKSEGVTVGYHNHSFEFVEEDGRHLIEYLFETADPEYVVQEVDVYWVKHAGLDPAAFITEYADRCKLIHMKDMTAGASPTFAPVGEGVMNIGGIVNAALRAGSDWFVVEQDRTTRPPFEAVEMSLNNLNGMLDGK